MHLPGKQVEGGMYQHVSQWMQEITKSVIIFLELGNEDRGYWDSCVKESPGEQQSYSGWEKVHES